MDTTQKNREETARRQRQEAPQRTQQRPQEAKKSRPAAASEPARRRPAQQAPAQTGEKKTAAANTAQRPRQPRPPQESAARPAQTGQKAARTTAAAGTKQRPVGTASQSQQAAKKKQETKKKAPPRQQKSQKRPASPAEPTDLSSKKRAYGNSKPKKKSALTRMGELVSGTVQKVASGTKTRKASKGKSTSRTVQPAPAVIYTQPKAFNRARLLVQMLTVAAIVVALVMGLSVFFKVENITVAGAEVYSAWSVREASGIEEGDNLLTFSHARAGALIKANLPYVKTVRFGIKLPDTVNIIIEEEDVVYAIKDNTGTWWLMNSKGRVVEMTNGSKAANYTQILGVTLDNPTPNTQAVATESLPTETDASGEPIPLTVTGAQRLEAAKQILEALENNDIVGDAASVDVSRIEDIILWYGTRYQVNLGDSSRLDYKIACMNDVILQLSDFQSGILDISFTIWPDKVVYTPFT